MRILRFKNCRTHPDQNNCWCGDQYDYLTKQGEPIKLTVLYDNHMMAHVKGNGWWYGWYSDWSEYVVKHIKHCYSPRWSDCMPKS